MLAASPQTVFAGLEQANLLLAISGGPDSMALLLLAERWRSATSNIAVATVDHGLRPQSRAEAEAVARWSAERSFDHAILTWTGDKPATGLPAAARAARYRLLASHAQAIGADTIVTAHHADDQAETVLMRLLRGSGPAGLAGMAARAPVPGGEAGDLTLARPLLRFAKADLIALCRTAGQAFFDDPTNADDSYRRPQIRRLAPILAAEGFSRPEILRLAGRAGRAEAALADLIDRQLETLPARREPGLFELAAGAVRSLSDEALIRLLLAEIMRLSPGATPRLEQLEEALARLRENPAAALTLGGVAIRLDARTLTLRPAPPRRAGGGGAA